MLFTYLCKHVNVHIYVAVNIKGSYFDLNIRLETVYISIYVSSTEISQLQIHSVQDLLFYIQFFFNT